VQAVISAEDKDFYKHPGINVFALARAAVAIPAVYVSGRDPLPVCFSRRGAARGLSGNPALRER